MQRPEYPIYGAFRRLKAPAPAQIPCAEGLLNIVTAGFTGGSFAKIWVVYMKDINSLSL